MPRLTSTVPKYRKRKAIGQAIVTPSGKDHYLGKHGAKASRQLYERLVGEWLAAGRQPAPIPDAGNLTVTQLLLRYWQHAKPHYRRRDGTPTGKIQVIKPAPKMR